MFIFSKHISIAESFSHLTEEDYTSMNILTLQLALMGKKEKEGRMWNWEEMDEGE